MITLPRTNRTRSGAFGTYFKLTRTKGIKVLNGRFRTLEAAYNSYIFDQAKSESEILKIAEASKVVPKCYGVRVVRHGKSFRVGILMQYLGNKRLSDLDLSDKEESNIYDKLNDALSHAGVEHNDLHTHNIMFHKGKYYAIDFSPDVSDINDYN